MLTNKLFKYFVLTLQKLTKNIQVKKSRLFTSFSLLFFGSNKVNHQTKTTKIIETTNKKKQRQTANREYLLKLGKKVNIIILCSLLQYYNELN